MLANESESLVARLATPYVHGMTMGELALLMRDRVAPDFKKLTIIKMKNWTRDMTFADAGLRWVPTSPQVPHAHVAAYYVATGIIGELLVLNNGVGYTLPFEIVGAPWANGRALAESLNKSAPSGLRYRPINFKPLFGKLVDQSCEGVQVYVDLKSPDVNLVEINFRILEAFDAPDVLERADPKRFNSFDKVLGTSEPRELLSQRKDLAPMFQKWRDQCEKFRKDRQKFLQY
jgi:uncharacterized protein YbbC (DUF1343 family)